MAQPWPRATRTKNRPQPHAGNGPHQPAQVEPGCTQHGVERITQLAPQPTLVHPVIGFQVPDRRFHRLAPT